MRLPSAEDLFRPTETSGADPTGPRAVHAVPAPVAAPDAVPGATTSPGDQPAASGRVRHDEKMTVYVTAEELLAIEQARLTLRARHGLAVDRGRLVREAVALVLADLETDGEDSPLVRRLTTR